MNPVSRDMADILEDNDVGTLGPGSGWRIFIGTEPVEGHQVITLYDHEGVGEQIVSGQVNESARLQIRVRGLDYSSTYAKIEEVKDILQGLFLGGRYVLSDVTYFGCRAYGTPFFLGRDDRERYTWSFNCDVCREKT
jgi:hypothetical protein